MPGVMLVDKTDTADRYKVVLDYKLPLPEKAKMMHGKIILPKNEERVEHNEN